MSMEEFSRSYPERLAALNEALGGCTLAQLGEHLVQVGRAWSSRPGGEVTAPQSRETDGTAVLDLDQIIGNYADRVDAYARELAAEMNTLLPGGLHLEWTVETSTCEDSALAPASPSTS